MDIKKILTPALCAFSFVVTAQSVTKMFSGADIHVGNGDFIAKGKVVTADQKIIWVGRSDENPEMRIDEMHDVTGKHIYPGFIAPVTAVGLVEVEAVRATVDNQEVGDQNPNARALIAYNTDSRVLPTLIYNGILIGQSTPEGGTISGQSSVMRLQAWNWEDAVIKADDGMHINWPNTMKFDYKKRKLVANEEYPKQVTNLLNTFAAAKAYLEGDRKEVNLKLAAFDGVFDGDKRVYVQTNKAAAMLEAIRELKQLGVRHIVLVGAADAPMIADYLADNQIPVILRRPHELPSYSDDATDASYGAPALLDEAGVVFALSNIGRMPVMGNRNLPFMAGTAIGHGLDYEAAVRALTLHPATIMGIEKNYGSIQVDKSATFLIASGDLFDMRSHHVEAAYIDGKSVDMENWQEQLFDKYMKHLESEN
ncbi:MAG: amidohydrolase family protein [Schleiferiaceae bacterium]|nr:amidohydrolase family protein [Schleiferiaceae bacterium]